MKLTGVDIDLRLPRRRPVDVNPEVNCFIAGTRVLTGDGKLVAIEDVDLGDRLATDGGLSNNGIFADDPHATDVQADGWDQLSIEASRWLDDGTLDTWRIDTMQLESWIEEQGLATGVTLDLSMVLDLAEMGLPEEGLVGMVLSISEVPAIDEGPGRVVLTTVNHLNSFVFDLTLRNAAGALDTLGVTGYHKFYDEAEGWQSASELTVGDLLRGRDGETLEVLSVEWTPGVERVYNFTVEADHVYYVGDLETLTHNNCSISMDEAIDRAINHAGPDADVMVTRGGNVQLMGREVVSTNGDATRNVSRLDVNPNDPHVLRQGGPHLNLEVQKNSVPQKHLDPHTPIDPATVRPGDYQ